MIEINVEEVTAIAQRAARAAASRVRGSSVEDLAQECWVWVMQHEHKLEEWYEDEDGGAGKLYRSLYHYCLDAAQRSKAERDGYKRSDLYYYSVPQLKKLLPWWFEEDKSDPPYVLPDRDSKIDLDNAWTKLSASDKVLIRKAFEGDPDIGEVYQTLAVEWDCSDDAARAKVDRTVRKLQSALGGPKPQEVHSGRKAISNARAQFITSHQYAGD